MRTVDWTDDDGLLQRSMLPDGEPDGAARLGVPVGGDMIDTLTGGGMPYDTAKRLQNELRRRGFWTYQDTRRPRAAEELFAALQTAYRVDVAAVTNIFKEADLNG